MNNTWCFLNMNVKSSVSWKCVFSIKLKVMSKCPLEIVFLYGHKLSVVLCNVSFFLFKLLFWNNEFLKLIYFTDRKNFYNLVCFWVVSLLLLFLFYLSNKLNSNIFFWFTGSQKKLSFLNNACAAREDVNDILSNWLIEYSTKKNKSFLFFFILIIHFFCYILNNSKKFFFKVWFKIKSKAYVVKNLIIAFIFYVLPLINSFKCMHVI